MATVGVKFYGHANDSPDSQLLLCSKWKSWAQVNVLQPVLVIETMLAVKRLRLGVKLASRFHGLYLGVIGHFC